MSTRTPQQSACIAYCFTINNPTSQLDFSTWDTPPVYAVWQHEVGEQGTPHYQGYVYLAKKQRITAIRHLLPGAHFENARGTPQENTDYCTKEDTRTDGPWFFGEMPVQARGKRSDWTAIRDMVKTGSTDREVAELFPGQYVRNHAGIAKLKGLYVEPRTTAPFVHVICGPPDSGKSHHCHSTYPSAYWKAPNNKWWDQYEYQTDVVLDEFNGWLAYNDLNRLCDKYEYRVEIKGATVPCPATKVIITSNHFPKTWYDFGEKIIFASFQRRVSKWSIYVTREDHRDFDTFAEFEEAWISLNYNITRHSVSVNTFRV